MSWALPLYRAWGIQVRVHILFVLYIIVMLFYSAFSGSSQFGPAFMAIALASLFSLVLLHEYGHCIACRRVGGEATDILLWPLGGLASCLPPDTWRANLITVLGGPAVNALLLPVFAGALALSGAPLGAILFNPFNPGAAVATLAMPSSLAFWLIYALWSLHYANIILLGFNLLVPMYPMDSARIVHALLWARRGKSSATSVTLTIGLIVAGVLILFGMVTRETLLMGIGFLGGVVCFVERRRMTALDDLAGPAIDLSAAFEHPDHPAPHNAPKDHPTDAKSASSRPSANARTSSTVSSQRSPTRGSTASHARNSES